ncbi:MAG TPA: hypothetical protein VFZ21_22230 [Gemmatimonadaceae bacterium]|jgi:hypothetical protein|nr:hypothetical protein [Gemmatimonadaceae bacterium]
MRVRDPNTIRYRSALGLAALAAACGGGRAEPEVAVRNARVAPAETVVTCEEWVRRAQADPELGVDRVPAPVAFNPAPIPRRLPKGVVGKDGKAEVRIRVVVDTLGAADMRTFAVVTSTHPTLTRSVRTAVAKWRFVPAEVGGCKVPRNFNWAAVASGPKADGQR